VLLKGSEKTSPPLQEGDQLLLNHNYGGVGGTMTEPAAKGPIYFGHFAYGIARVVLEPLTDDLRLEIQYFQVYTHNGDGSDCLPSPLVQLHGRSPVRLAQSASGAGCGH
jgi:predicted Abi (CAAX) family protease